MRPRERRPGRRVPLDGHVVHDSARVGGLGARRREVRARRADVDADRVDAAADLADARADVGARPGWDATVERKRVLATWRASRSSSNRLKLFTDPCSAHGSLS